MDDVLARMMSRRKLLQALGITAVGTPLAAALGTSAFAQGGCRDGYGQAQGRCTLSKEVATAAIKPVFDSTGWKTIGLDHLTFEVADYKKEAAFYTALMGWKLRSDDGKQAVMDIGEWGSVVFKTAAPGKFDTAAAPAPRGGAAGGRGGNRAPLRAQVTGFSWVIDQWDAKKVESELKKRGMTPVAENGPGGFESFHVKDPDGWDLQICNSNGLLKARKTPSTAKLTEAAPFESTGWKTIWLDHLSFGVTNYKQSASYYQNLLGWMPSYDEGTQNEMMIGDIGDAIVRGGNPNDPNFGKDTGGRGGRGGGGGAAAAGGAHIDHISFGISPWDVDGVREALERRELTVSVDTSSAHMGPDGKIVSDDIHQAAFQSYHTTTPNGYNLQISWMSKDKRLALANAVKPKSLLKQ
jgi:catechol 2,3-dioxygenase-like lactoylglutathione lyase family enzyme